MFYWTTIILNVYWIYLHRLSVITCEQNYYCEDNGLFLLPSCIKEHNAFMCFIAFWLVTSGSNIVTLMFCCNLFNKFIDLMTLSYYQCRYILVFNAFNFQNGFIFICWVCWAFLCWNVEDHNKQIWTVLTIILCSLRLMFFVVVVVGGSKINWNFLRRWQIYVISIF